VKEEKTVTDTINDFNGFGLHEKMLKALKRMNFTAPTPIQAQTLPHALAGRDVLGSAQTGTGKTAAFGIPLIAHLLENPEATALVMTPTRELAAQVVAALQQMIPTPDIRTALLIGGESMPRQFRQLDQKPRLIVGTPGRINDHLTRGTVKLGAADFLVLDEADRMLDMGFGVQIEKIIQKMPKQRQTLLFSATFSKTIIGLASKYLNNPERISIGSTSQPLSKIKQELIQTSNEKKYQHLLAEIMGREGSIIIFVKTKFGTQRLADKLCREDHRAEAIHGDLQQRRRDRVISSFREKKYRILVATDVAARGLDIPHIEHVINYDLPQCPEDYIHRIGRTARAGAEGSAVNLITPEDGSKWKAIHRLMEGHDVGPTQGKSGPKKGKSGFKGKFKGNGNGNKNKKSFKPNRSFKPAKAA
jgi:superfamily II DNA/RNA helicase